MQNELQTIGEVIEHYKLDIKVKNTEESYLSFMSRNPFFLVELTSTLAKRKPRITLTKKDGTVIPL